MLNILITNLFTVFSYPPTKNTENLRRICRTDCELLENEVCQKEYAIAKRHPTIGQILSLEDCMDLEDEDDCLSMGINIDIKTDDTCYWDNGAGYRGIKDRSINNRPCIKWSKSMREITHIELTGNNYCRNVDHTQRQPWCYVDKQKTVELCDIPKCADRMWFLIICGLVTFLSLTLCFTLVVCCKKMRKQGVSNIQNVSKLRSISIALFI
jgi:receptor tyrosine kinase-like orphan receptor 1